MMKMVLTLTMMFMMTMFACDGGGKPGLKSDKVPTGILMMS